MIKLSFPIRIDYTFGYRHNQSTWYGTKHRGVDLIVPKNTPCYAPADGEVIYSNYHWQYGHQIKIQLADLSCNFTSYMTHFEKRLVVSGEIVKRGQLIGLTGNSGKLTTGPHLHWHIAIDGQIKDPLNYISMAYEEYEDKVLRNVDTGSYGYVLSGKLRLITEERSGFAAMTILQRKSEIINVASKIFNEIPRGDNF